MTRLEIATLACKLLAVWAFTQAILVGPLALVMFIEALAGLGSWGFHWSDVGAAAVTGLPAAGAAFIGFALWIYAPQLAAGMVSGDPEPVNRPDLDHEAVLSVAFAAVGLWTLIPALRDLASDAVTIFRGSVPFSHYWSDSRWQGRICSTLLEIGLSIWLLVGTRGVVRLVLMLRHRDGETRVLPPGGFQVVRPDGAEEPGTEQPLAAAAKDHMRA